MDDNKTIRNFIIIFVVIIVFVIGAYLLTKFVINKEEKKEETQTSKEVQIDNSIAIVGTMLSKAEDNYYVLIFKNDDNAGKYLTIKSQYEAKKNKKALYTVDLANKLNEKYYDKDNVNLSASDINDLRFGDITLLEVKQGKIVKSYDTIEKIKKVWELS